MNFYNSYRNASLIFCKVFYKTGWLDRKLYNCGMIPITEQHTSLFFACCVDTKKYEYLNSYPLQQQISVLECVLSYICWEVLFSFCYSCSHSVLCCRRRRRPDNTRVRATDKTAVHHEGA